MRDRLETALSVLLTVAGLAIAGAVVTRELSGNRVPSAEPEEIKNWEQLRETGIRTGDAASPVVILEFSDFQCPFCRTFNGRLAALRQKYGAQIGHVFVHYPLDNHAFARRAAHAAECAHLQGRFEPFATALFALT